MMATQVVMLRPLGAGSRPRWERDRDRDGSGIATAIKSLKQHCSYTDIDEISKLSGGLPNRVVDSPPIQSLACTRFPTIHRPNYYYHWMNNKKDASSGESE